MEQISRPDAAPSIAETLHSQLREMYGRAAYAHKAHEKMADIYVARYKRIKAFEIALSAITAGSLLIAVFGDSHAGTVVGAILSTLLLGITLYVKEGGLGEQAQKHTVVASKLWAQRERLLSLIVDLDDGRAVSEIRDVRDRVNEELEAIYRTAPRTNASAYKAAQAALKSNEDLFFSTDELDRMLPERLRRNQ